MKKKAVVMVLAVLVMAVVLGACVTGVDEEIKNADQQVRQNVLVEKNQLHDNGKNFLYIKIDYYGTAELMIVLQEWLDRHPNKDLRIISQEGTNYTWLVYYVDKESR